MWKKFNLKKKPNNSIFENSILKEWKEWDKLHGVAMEDYRIDYKPYAYQSLKGIHTNNYLI